MAEILSHLNDLQQGDYVPLEVAALPYSHEVDIRKQAHDITARGFTSGENNEYAVVLRAVDATGHYGSTHGTLLGLHMGNFPLNEQQDLIYAPSLYKYRELQDISGIVPEVDALRPVSIKGENYHIPDVEYVACFASGFYPMAATAPSEAEVAISPREAINDLYGAVNHDRVPMDHAVGATLLMGGPMVTKIKAYSQAALHSGSARRLKSAAYSLDSVTQFVRSIGMKLVENETFDDEGKLEIAGLLQGLSTIMFEELYYINPLAGTSIDDHFSNVMPKEILRRKRLNRHVDNAVEIFIAGGAPPEEPHARTAYDVLKGIRQNAVKCRVLMPQ